MIKYLLIGLLLFSTKSYSSDDSSSQLQSLQEIETRCPTPKRGPPGPAGPPGIPGIPGATFSSSFLSVFTTLDGVVFPHAPFIFNQFAIPTQGPALIYDNTTGTVTFLQTGFYQVSYGISVAPSPFNNLIALQINPAGVYAATPGFVPGSGLVPGSELNVLFPDQMTSETVIVDITIPGQTLQLVNANTTGPIILQASTTGTTLTPITGYLVVEKLN